MTLFHSPELKRLRTVDEDGKEFEGLQIKGLGLRALPNLPVGTYMVSLASLASRSLHYSLLT